MQTSNSIGARHQSNEGRSGKPANADFDIDLERVIYDPAYRADVRDQLNRLKSGRDRDGNA